MVVSENGLGLDPNIQEDQLKYKTWRVYILVFEI